MIRFAVIALVCFIATATQAQLFKKKSKKGEVAHTDYAYQTQSTLGKKQKVSSHGGSNDPKFHVEKPVRSTPNGNNRMIRQRDSFGKKISPNRKTKGRAKAKKAHD